MGTVLCVLTVLEILMEPGMWCALTGRTETLLLYIFILLIFCGHVDLLAIIRASPSQVWWLWTPISQVSNLISYCFLLSKTIVTLLKTTSEGTIIDYWCFSTLIHETIARTFPEYEKGRTSTVLMSDFCVSAQRSRFTLYSENCEAMFTPPSAMHVQTATSNDYSMSTCIIFIINASFGFQHLKLLH